MSKIPKTNSVKSVRQGFLINISRAKSNILKEQSKLEFYEKCLKELDEKYE